MHAMERVLLATNNPGKVLELTNSLSSLSIQIVTPSAISHEVIEPEETGTTFEANAEIKARYWAEKSGLAALSDDGGIVVDALPGQLGVHTKHFGEKAFSRAPTDKERIDYFLEVMKNVPEEKRTATFFCCVCFMRPRSQPQFFTGRCRGHMRTWPSDTIIPGIALSSLFVPEGHTHSYAELSSEEKNAISHRGKAVAAFSQWYQKH